MYQKYIKYFLISKAVIFQSCAVQKYINTYTIIVRDVKFKYITA